MGMRGEGLLLSTSDQGFRSSRGAWRCRRGGAQACCWLPPPGWVPSPRARRRPNRPTGLIPRPVYQEGSMSGSERQKQRTHQGVMAAGDTEGGTGHCTHGGVMTNLRGLGKGAGGDKSCPKGCFKANLCFCTVTPHCPPNAAESGDEEWAGGGGLAGGSPLLLLSLLLISMERSWMRPWATGRVRQASSRNRRQAAPSFIPATSLAAAAQPQSLLAPGASCWCHEDSGLRTPTWLWEQRGLAVAETPCLG